MCTVAPYLNTQWAPYLGVLLLFSLVFHHAFKTIWSWRVTWLLGIFTSIIFAFEAMPL
jgi:hypothetical protein